VQDAAKAAFQGRFSSTVDKFPEVSNYLGRALDDLNPACVLRIFQKVPDADVPLLGLATRPEHLLIVSLAAPPVCIRPSVEMDVGAASNEDDATTRLLAVCDMSVSIRKNLDAGIASWETIMEQWDFLQARCFARTRPLSCLEQLAGRVYVPKTSSGVTLEHVVVSEGSRDSKDAWK
jgi:DNA-directed RNA polymerase beta' subunit